MVSVHAREPPPGIPGVVPPLRPAAASVGVGPWCGSAARALLRRRFWGTVAVALLVGLAGGAVLASLAGARRTDSAIGRFFAASNEPDETMFPLDFRESDRLQPAAVEALPGVSAVGSGLGFLLATRSADGSVEIAGNADAIASENEAFFDIGRAIGVQGHFPASDRIGEVFVNDVVAEDYDLSIGSRLPIGVARFSDLLELGPDAGPEEFEALFQWVDVEVVGIGRVSDQLLANQGQERGVMVLSQAFAAALGDYATYRVLAVDLASPDDAPRFEAALRDLYADLPLQVTPRTSKQMTFDRIVQPYVDALRLFAVAAAVTGLLVTVQALARLVAADGVDGPVLGCARCPARRASAGGGAAVLAGRGPRRRARGADRDRGIAAVPARTRPGRRAPRWFPDGRAGPRRRRPAGGARSGLGVGLDRVAPSPPQHRAVRPRGGRPDVGQPRAGWLGSARRCRRPPACASRWSADRSHGAAPLAITLFGLVVAISSIGAALTFGANLQDLVSHARSLRMGLGHVD